MEALFIGWLKAYGYIILFFWSIIEGEMGLVMAGIMTHTGHMQYMLAVFVAGLGGFTGDQGFFYLGRFNMYVIAQIDCSALCDAYTRYAYVRIHTCPNHFSNRRRY